jgi:hypothetical protein
MEPVGYRIRKSSPGHAAPAATAAQGDPGQTPGRQPSGAHEDYGPCNLEGGRGEETSLRAQGRDRRDHQRRAQSGANEVGEIHATRRQARCGEDQAEDQATEREGRGVEDRERHPTPGGMQELSARSRELRTDVSAIDGDGAQDQADGEEGGTSNDHAIRARNEMMLQPAQEGTRHRKSEHRQ